MHVRCDLGVRVRCDLGVRVRCDLGVRVRCDLGVRVHCDLGVRVRWHTRCEQWCAAAAHRVALRQNHVTHST